MANKATEDKISPKLPFGLFSVEHLLLGIGPALKYGLYNQRDSLLKLIFHVHSCQLEVAFLLGIGAFVNFPSELPLFPVLYGSMHDPCMMSQSQVHMCVSLVVSGRHCFLDIIHLF